MRKRKSFRPTGLDGLESRIALSTIGAVSAEVAKSADRHDHAPKVDHPADHQVRHDDHEAHAKKS